MTRDETVTVLAGMVAAWPNMEVHPSVTDLWVHHLADVEPAHAQQAFDRLVASDAWPPTIARFREVAAACAPRPAPALPLPRLPLPEARAAIDDARRALGPRR